MIPARSIEYTPNSTDDIFAEIQRPQSLISIIYPSSITPVSPKSLSPGKSPMLPYDVIAMILAYFLPEAGACKSSRKPGTFASLTRVSHDWCSYVRLHLYRLATASANPQQRLCCVTLANSPQLASLARNCTIASQFAQRTFALGWTKGVLEFDALTLTDSFLHGLDNVVRKSGSVRAPAPRSGPGSQPSSAHLAAISPPLTISTNLRSDSR